MTFRTLTAVTLDLIAVPAWTLAVPLPADAADEPAVPSATELLKFRSAMFAGGGQLQNPTSFCFDLRGRMLVTETHRWLAGVEDNRAHTYWIMDDLASQTLPDRAKIYEKFKDRFTEGYFTEEAERVVRLTDIDGDGAADEAKVFADGFHDMLDGPAIGILAASKNDVLLACIPHLWRLRDADDDGVAEARVPLLSGFGIRNSLSGHDLHGLTWGPDGKLYFSMGDRGYVVPTREGATLANPNSGAVFRCNSDGTGLELFYHGLRNPQELAFNELGDLFTVDNNCDQGDQARVCWLLDGGDSGWHIGHQALTTYKPFIRDGGFEQRPHWLGEHLWEKPQAGQPRWILPPVDHVTDGPSGLLFTSGLSLPERYANSFLVCDYKGAANQCRLWSFKVQPRDAGYAMKDAHVFQTGVACVDVDEGPDGKMYVADFGGTWTKNDAGAIYSLWWPEGMKRSSVAETKLLLGRDFDDAPTVELLGLLTHPDQRVRQRAQFAIARRGPEMVEPLLGLVREKASLHALWALQELKALSALRACLDHAHAEVRAQAARALGDLRDGEAIPRLQVMVSAEAPRERVFAAIALGKLGNTGAFGDLVSMIEKWGVEDPFQRHAGVMGLAGTAEPKMLSGLAKHPSGTVRLTAALALRKVRSPLIAELLRDADIAIAAEAVRAINDIPIAEAQPVLAAQARRFFGQVPPALFQDEMLFRRLLRANQCVGSPEAAAAVAQLAVHPALPESARLLALRTLEHFAEPPPIDPTTGLWRPLPTRDKAPIKAAIAATLHPLLATASGAPTAAALRVAGVFGLIVGESSLAAWAADERQPLVLRLAAVERLGPMVRPLLDTITPEVRAAAARRWVSLQPDDIDTALRILLAHDTAIDRRTAYELMAVSSNPAARAALLAALEAFISGRVPDDVQLDLLEAAALRQEPAVKEKLAAAEAALTARQRSLFDLTFSGGDPARGRSVFENQGLCLKCHRITSVGGRAGPKLDELARRLKPPELLQSLLDPNAVIADGYGIVSFTLDDGSAVAGTPLEESETTLSMRTPSGSIEKITKSKIKDRSPVISPMPPLGQTLTKKDLRDLMAYLRTLE